MKIERANNQDHTVLTEIMRKSKAVWGYEQKQLQQWEDELTVSQEYINQNPTFKLSIDKKVIGFYAYRNQGQNIKLDSLFIDPKNIGKGFGKILLKHFLDNVQLTNTSKKVILDADPNAEKFYLKNNFKTIGLQKTSIKDRFMPIMVLSNTSLENIRLFDSERLYVRHLKKDDIEGFYKMQSNPNVMRYIKPSMNYEESRKELNRFIEYYNKRDMMFRIWALVEKDTDSFVGICGVYLNQNEEFEIAYRFQESHWGKGFGKEIAESLVNFCFETFNYDNLFAYVVEGNLGSTKILDRLMELKGEVFLVEENAKNYIYQIKKENWLKSNI